MIVTGRDRDPLAETLAVFDATADHGAPLTASEVAENMDCTRRTAYDRLTDLADRGDLRTKKVGARGRVWWRDLSSDDVDSEEQADGAGELDRQRAELTTRERSLRRAYEIVADPERSFADQIDDLLALVRETVGTDYATLSQIQDEEYLFEAVDAPAGAGLEPGDTVPLETTNCERAVATERTLVLNDVEEDAPDLAQRADNAEWGISSYLGTPVTVGSDVYGTFCFYDTEARSEDFSDWQVAFVELLGNWVGNELERQRTVGRLAALNELNAVAGGIVDAVLDQSTREEIETTVCELLAAAESYEFAWVADVDSATGTVDSRCEAGVDGYLESADLSTGDTEWAGEGPAETAFRTGETQVVKDVFDDPAFESWRQQADADGFRSFAAIPVVHEGTIYGVIGLYSDRTGAFAEEERRLVDQLGEIVGHVIGSAERKRALMSDELVAVEFRVENAFDDVEMTGTITFEETVAVVDGEFLVYGTATEGGRKSLAALVETRPNWDGVSFRSDDDDPARFELGMTEPPLLSAIASLGGDVDSAVIEDGDMRVTVHLSPSVDVRQLIDTVQDTYPSAELTSRRQFSRSDERVDEPRRLLESGLTDRQRAAIQAAYHAGFFAWPRESSGEDVASSLGVSPPTFHQHLRKAEQKVFDSLLGANTSTPD